MKVIKPTFYFEDDINGEEILKKIERMGRVCYKSSDKITPGSAERFVKAIIKSGHESVIEHEKISVLVVCDRGITHEIVRHRLASYSQESSRYCNYSKNKFGSEITVVDPCFWRGGSEEDKAKRVIWETAMKDVENMYMQLIDLGASAQEARSVLPNSLKSELVMTMNLREWRHFFKVRTSEAAHPQMREIARMMLDGFKDKISIVFDDINY